MIPCRPLACLFAVLLAGACGPPSGGSGPTAAATPSAAPTAGRTATPPAMSSEPSVAPSPTPPFEPDAISLVLEPFAQVPGRPVGIANAGDGSGRMFVVEQGGVIRVVRDGTVLGTPFLDVSGRISAGGERGLLGLAFHPRYPNDSRFFVNYTDGGGDTVVASFSADPADPDRADPGTEVVLVRIDQPYGNHNGGALAFGPDGQLHISTGDGGSGGDPHDNGQRLDTLLGKILRIDVDRPSDGRTYGIPSDNPFVGRAGARPEIWLFGLRNPWRMAFDRATGDLWLGDVGQGGYEEIDVARAGSGGGANYGWARMEGFHCFPSGDGCARPELTPPVTEYGHDAGCSVIGGAVYRGVAHAALVGGYVFSDYCSGSLWVIDASTDDPREPHLAGESGRNIAAFGEDEAGELYAADHAGAILEVALPEG